MTPGELWGRAAVYAEQVAAAQRDAWLQTAWLACHIGPMVWSKRTYDPYELLQMPRPRVKRPQISDEENLERWRAYFSSAVPEEETSH